jgi:uncharacterized protein (TIGR03790 family)
MRYARAPVTTFRKAVVDLSNARASAVFGLALCAVSIILPSPARALDHTQLAVIINTSDPLSVRIGEYYAAQRRISFQNLIRIEFPPGQTTLTREEFAAVKVEVDKRTLPRVQAYALTWAAPYRVECMSITSAFAFGLDPDSCALGCKPTPSSRYFNSRSALPFTHLKIRPTMAIAATTFEHAKELIDRGVAADGSFPAGTVYLLSTSDTARNVRSPSYPLAEQLIRGRLYGRTMKQNSVKYATDVLFYFTGVGAVEGLDTLRFVPGAIADHLTSAGGNLTDSSQMSALRWLEAGATASYGAVVEPCNLPQKFPSPPVVIGHYLRGETLIEAYWKSVQMPWQGIFIGEPLAAPFRKPAAR